MSEASAFFDRAFDLLSRGVIAQNDSRVAEGVTSEFVDRWLDTAFNQYLQQSVPYARLSDAEFVAAVDSTLQEVWRELVAEEFGAAAGVNTKRKRERAARSIGRRMPMSQRVREHGTRRYLDLLKNNPPPKNREEAGGGVWDEGSYEGKEFRRRFRIPFGMFVDHLEELKLRFGDEFPQRVGEEHWYPVELLVMGSLLQLATGMKPFWLELCTGVDSQTQRIFSQEKYFKWMKQLALEEITMPKTEEELEHVMGHYRSIGLPGCTGSIDCVHVFWNKCPAGLLNSCQVGNKAKPSLSFEFVVSHTGFVLSVSQFFYGCTNDKTICKLDEAIELIKEGELSKLEFFVRCDDGKTEKLTGPYFICDGGYLDWMCLIPPFKHMPEQSKEHGWSKYVESVRKDVERVFGILKKRFYILVHAFEQHDERDIENIVVTCALLHNRLLIHDGHDNWQEDGEATWLENAEGQLDEPDFSFILDERINEEAMVLQGLRGAGAEDDRTTNTSFVRSQIAEIRNLLTAEPDEDKIEMLERDLFLKRRLQLVEHYENTVQLLN
eukprot:scaffold64230_cov41-Attheya_sp.AAC.2